jgi:hypothetical protein
LGAASVFLQCGGLILTAQAILRFGLGWNLQCQQLVLTRRGFEAKDLVVFDARSYPTNFVLRADRALFALPRQLSFDNPQLSLTQRALEESQIDIERWVIEAQGGALNWLDQLLPSGTFDFFWDRKRPSSIRFSRQPTEVRVDWDPVDGATHIRANCQELPLAWVDRRVTSGTVSGKGEGVFSSNQVEWVYLAGLMRDFRSELGVAVSSAELEWESGPLSYVDVSHPSVLFQAARRWRLECDRAALATGSVEWRDLRVSSSYHKKGGGKGEVTGVAQQDRNQVPVSGSIRISPAQWADVEASFGALTVRAESNHLFTSDWALSWEQLTSLEVSLLASLWPRSKGWAMISGDCSGKALWLHDEGRLSLESFVGIDVALEYASPPVRLGCGLVRYDPHFSIEDAWIETEGISLRDWSGGWEELDQQLRFQGLCNGQESLCRIQEAGGIWRSEFFAAGLGEGSCTFRTDRDLECSQFFARFGGMQARGSGTISLSNGSWSLAVPEFSGPLAPVLTQRLPLKAAEIESRGQGFWAAGTGTTCDRWFLSCAAQGIRVELGTMAAVEEARCELTASERGFDAGKVAGTARLQIAGKSLSVPFEIPRISGEGETVQFDVRCLRDTWSFLRLAGIKRGGVFSFDSRLCHFLGAPLLVENVVLDGQKIASGSVGATLSLPLLRSLLSQDNGWGHIPMTGSVQLSGSFGAQQPLRIAIWGLDTAWRDFPFPLEFSLEQGIAKARVGPFQLQGQSAWNGEVFRIREGRGAAPGAQFEWEGKIDAGLSGEFSIRRGSAELSRFSELFQSTEIPLGPLSGLLEGHGYISLNSERVEADFTFDSKHVQWGDFRFQNQQPLHLFLSSAHGAVLKGLDFTLAHEQAKVLGKVDLCQIDLKRRRWILNRTDLCLPAELLSQLSRSSLSFLDPKQEVVFTAEIDCAFDLSEFSCVIPEGQFPIGGEGRRVENLQLFYNPREFIGRGTFLHRGKEASIAMAIDLAGPALGGRCMIEERECDGETPLTVDWSWDDQGLALQAIEGAFSGFDASFHAEGIDTHSRLIGSARIDWSRILHWFPPSVAEGFGALKMGKGYELKGRLAIGRRDWKDVEFRGIFSGKQIELCGFQLRTLLAQTQLSTSMVRLYDLKISDNAGMLKIDELRIEGGPSAPWTVLMPRLTLDQFRPSLLHAPEEEPGELTPFLIRTLSIQDFRGTLGEARSFTAHGELSFLNSFRRGEALLEWPKNIFGRLVGLDLGLLVPVTGQFSFELKDGFFHLRDLKDAYSEGKRSQFFLVENENSPRIGLNGQIQILIRMKQFVLFKFTDAFMISIEGSLPNPQFRLQKKRRFPL